MMLLHNIIYFFSFESTFFYLFSDSKVGISFEYLEKRLC